MKKFKKIIIRCPNWVGDIVMATPFYDCIKKNFPKASLIGLTRRGTDNIIKDGPWFDRILTVDDKGAGGFLNTVRTIRGENADMAFLLPNSMRSLLEMRIGGVNEIYGYRRGGRGIMLNGPEPVRKNGRISPLPMVEYYLGICRWMGLDVHDAAPPSLYFSESLKSQGDVLLQKYNIKPDDMVVGINPGASFGSSKCWPSEYFARIADILEDVFKCRILLFSGPGEKKIADEIMNKTKSGIINTFSDKVDLALLKPMASRCNLFITNDTGPRHYAVAFGIPVVVIMGPTNPIYTASNLEKTIVLRRDITCSPCHKKICPHNHACMMDISPEMVIDAVKVLWEMHGK